MNAKEKLLNSNDETIKRIKKNIYGTLQTVKIIYPPGFSSVALNEIQVILDNPWSPKKMVGEVTFNNNEIIIRNIHMFFIIELLIRSQSLTDIRLVIFQGKTRGQFDFKKKCLSLPWKYYLNKAMSLKIKINSIASKAFHETALKAILGDIIEEHVANIVSGENSHETTTLYADLYKDKLMLSISLAGEPLYKRGYRGILKASAPLREDAAICCIKKSLEFVKKFQSDFIPNTMIVPFSGTGTFIFEYLQAYFHFSPILFEREYALQKMLLFRAEHFKFLFKKAKENCCLQKQIDTHSTLQILSIDPSEKANISFLENLTTFNSLFKKNGLEPIHITLIKDDFLKINSNNYENIFIPLNPPYGLRLKNYSNPLFLYQNIAKKINEIAFSQKNNGHVLGFILCPNKETWSSFLKYLKQAKTETYHFTQGGKDIRVCQFYI
jgi:23S rRNA G2445 N2-methylase RlmL